MLYVDLCPSFVGSSRCAPGNGLVMCSSCAPLRAVEREFRRRVELPTRGGLPHAAAPWPRVTPVDQERAVLSLESVQEVRTGEIQIGHD